MSGGGGGVTSPIAFLTDVSKNRTQRAAFGTLIRNLRIVNESDCILSLHTSGKMYRALDLITEVVEKAGASVLPLGHLATPEEILAVCKNFKPTIITGDTSQLLHLASYIQTTKSQHHLNITSLIYTSEPLSQAQQTYLTTIFSRPNKPINICSFFASAEMGIWAAGNLALTGLLNDQDPSQLIYDSRNMIIEVLPHDFEFPSQKGERGRVPCKIGYEHDRMGLLVVTSLQRLRNPLVRYFTGDVGSVGLLSDEAKKKIHGDNVEYLRVLKLKGRDERRSFKWEGEYFEFSDINRKLASPDFSILRWQIIIEEDREHEMSERLKIVILREGGGGEQELREGLKEFFCVHRGNERLFDVKIVQGVEGFVRSQSGRKVVWLVNRRKEKKCA